MWKKSSMRGKLMLTILLGCMLPYFAGGFYLNERINQSLYQSSIENSRKVLEQVSEQINQSLIQDMQEEVDLVASFDIVKNATGNLNNYTEFHKDSFVYQEYKVEKELEGYFQKLTENHKNLNFIFLATENGEYMEYPKFSPDETYDPRERSWYKEAIKKDEVYISEPYITSITNEMVISFSKSIWNNDQKIGVIGITVNLDELSDSISQIHFGKTGYVMLLSPQKRFIVCPQHHEWILKTPEETGVAGFKELLDEDETHFTAEIEHETYVINPMLNSNGWKIISVVSKEEVLQQARQATQILVMIYIVTILFIMMILYPIMNHLLKPMKIISDEIRRLSELDFSHNNEFKKLQNRNDEIGTVVTAFNDMQNKVNRYFKELTDNNLEINLKNDLLVATEEELTAQLEEISEQKDYIDYLAYHDHLTNLPNRRKFMEYLTSILETSQNAAVILLDLDDFKGINDVRGHSFGDEVLKGVAKRFEEILDDQVFISRFGGDEFLFLIKYDHDISEIEEKIVKIRNLFEESMVVDGSHVMLRCSIGVSLYPNDSKDVNQLIMQADLAMYSVKNANKNGHQYFHEDMLKNQIRVSEIEEILRDAITQDGFMMLYQPMVDTRTGQIAAYEALLRLKDGQASPAEFIKIAEKNGMIIQIGRLVTQAVIKQMHLWKESGMDLKPVSINFSANQLQDIGYLDFLQEQLSFYQIAPQFLEIEITENILMENLQLTMQFLNKLREMGVAIAIDDFGTGFSSLNYLSFMPVNIVKLDRSLNLKFLEHDKLQVMESLISLVHSLGLTVVAEGIEKEEHVELLRQFGCDLIQGYYFSRPVPAEQILTGTI